MSKKFSIVKTMDLNKLCNEIHDYEIMAGEKNPYIFVNEETLDAMVDSVIALYPIKTTLPYKKTTGIVGRWYGNKIFIDSTLGFGEVEIR